MTGCGCDRRCEKLLYWLGWRRQGFGPPGSGSYVFETPWVAVALPQIYVRIHHTRAALLGLAVRLLYGRNRYEGPPVDWWEVPGPFARPLRVPRSALAADMVLATSKGGNAWGAVWFPIFRGRRSVPVPAAVEAAAESQRGRG